MRRGCCGGGGWCRGIRACSCTASGRSFDARLWWVVDESYWIGFVVGVAGFGGMGERFVLLRRAVLGWGMCVCLMGRHDNGWRMKILIVRVCGSSLFLWFLCRRCSGCGVVRLRV